VQWFDREKAYCGIGILQIGDTWQPVLSIFNAHSPPNMRLVSRKVQC
jgi:hypothetical protein